MSLSLWHASGIHDESMMSLLIEIVFLHTGTYKITGILYFTYRKSGDITGQYNPACDRDQNNNLICNHTWNHTDHVIFDRSFLNFTVNVTNKCCTEVPVSKQTENLIIIQKENGKSLSQHVFISACSYFFCIFIASMICRIVFLLLDSCIYSKLGTFFYFLWFRIFSLLVRFHICVFSLHGSNHLQRFMKGHFSCFYFSLVKLAKINHSCNVA